MRLWGGESDTGCCSVADVDDARRVAQQLGIPHYVFSFGDEFHAGVVEPYIAAHAAGRTPNPCIECNRTVKFDHLLRRADASGVDAVELVTIGQRRGLGLPGGADPRYVVDVVGDTVVVGSAGDLLVDHVTLTSLTWVDAPVTGEVLVQCSAHGVAVDATVDGDVV